MQKFSTIGSGTQNDRAAQLVMQTLGVLERRLGNPIIIRMLYIDNPTASTLIPQTVYEVARQYVGGGINESQARERLQDASRQYSEVFKEMGIMPHEIDVLFPRQ